MPQTQLEREIFEQPHAMRRLLTEERDNIQQIAAVIRERAPQFITLAARGSSDNAGRYGQYLFGAANALTMALTTPSLFTLYGQPPHIGTSLALAISQSGQSPDIVSVIAEGRKQGALTVALTNATDSPLAQTAEHVINMRAGVEKSVAATKTYTQSLLALAMLSSALAGDAERLHTLESLPHLVEQVLHTAATTIKAAERYRYMNACVVVSRGYNYASAYETALKLKELTYTLAEPYSSADFQHGPVALVEDGFPVIAIIAEGQIAPEMLDYLRNLQERGAELVVISALEEALELAQTPLPIPAGVPEWMSPIVNIIQGQLFAFGLTVAKRYNIDQPRGIRKVTLTE